MKHSYFKTSICLVLSLFLLLSSCQKQIDTQFEEPVLKENFIAEAKAWFTTGPVAAEKKILDLPVGILQELAPQRLFARMGKMQKKLEWGNAELYNREGVKYLVVPVTTKLKKYGNDYEIAKSLVFYKEKGDEMKMNVIEVLSKKGTSLHGKSKEIIATAFLNNIKNKTDQITGINVEVFIYSEEYKNIGKYEFKNGLFASSTKKLKIDNKLGNNNNQNNSGINTESGSCQTWYIVYEEHNQNGELVYWVVLYSYQTGNCGGGGDPEEEMPEGEGGGGEGSSCNMSIEDADAILASITTSPDSNGGFQVGAETSPDASGIIRKPVVVNRHGVANNYGLGYSDNHQLFFNGILFKTSINSAWKWESLVFSQVMRVSGSTPPCITSDVTASVSGPIISADKLSASFTSSVTTTVSVGCVGGARVGSNIVTISGTYNANAF